MKAKCKNCNWAYSMDCLDRDENDVCENFEPAYELEDESVSGEAVIRALEIIKEFCEDTKGTDGRDRCFIKSWCYGMENNSPRDLEVLEL